MKKTEIDKILNATGGSLIAEGKEKYITGVRHDSREVEAGDMFVAIKGENSDGHSYIPSVCKKGCRTVLVSHTDGWPGDINAYRGELNIILVDDTVQAMGKLAAWYLAELGIKKAAVTGSVGKTSTRDMIYYVLSERYNCGRNLKNYNNNIGLPLSIFRFDENTEAAVLEMGMDAFGEIEYLSGIVKPDIGVITNIGVAHMEKLGSREGIFTAKMEIAGNIAPADKGGALVFAGDDTFLTKERTAGDYRQIEIGFDEKSDYRISGIDDFGIEGIEFYLTCKGSSTKIKLPVPGKHNAVNAAIALAVGNLMGVDIETGAAGLTKTSLTGSRLRKVEGKTVTIIDDTYNANPASAMSAIDVLARSRAERKVAILGDMLELGADTAKQHREVGEHAAKAGIDAVAAIGRLAENIAEGAGGAHFDTKEAFLEVMPKFIRPGDMVLVKASRGMKLEDIVKALEEI